MAYTIGSTSTGIEKLVTAFDPSGIVPVAVSMIVFAESVALTDITTMVPIGSPFEPRVMLGVRVTIGSSDVQTTENVNPSGRGMVWVLAIRTALQDAAYPTG